MGCLRQERREIDMAIFTSPVTQAAYHHAGYAVAFADLRQRGAVDFIEPTRRAPLNMSA